MSRLFYAVDLPEEIKRKLYEVSREFKAPGISAVQETNLHVTLLFVGDVSQSKIEFLKDALLSLKEKRFMVRVRGVSTFDADKPRVIFANIEEGGENLSNIYAHISDSLQKNSVPFDDKPFNPHITIARVRRLLGKGTYIKMKLASFSDFEFGSFECAHILLKDSILTPSGPTYSDLEEKRFD